jgi:MraZ protein
VENVKNDSLMFSDDFLGTYNVVVDKKNRFSFPAEFRSKLKGKTLIITKGMDGCLYIFTDNRYRTFCERQFNAGLGREKRAIRKLKRALTADAIKKKLDKQGRLLITKNLLDFADIKKDMLVVGVGDRIELWNKKSWEKEQQSLVNIEDLLEQEL